MAAGISLSNKCQLLFGAAIVAILTATLAVPWSRSNALVRDFQVEEARRIADAWLADRFEIGLFRLPAGLPDDELAVDASLRLTYVTVEQIHLEDPDHPFFVNALEHFRADTERTEYHESVEIDDAPVFRYARPIRASVLQAIRDPSVTEFNRATLEPAIADPLRAILVVDRTTDFARSQLLRNQVFIIAAGLVGGLLAILVFYLILTKLILSPVRTLRLTTETVQSGDLSVRSEISTGDEFEQLADGFNAMLDQIARGQQQLEAMNHTLDLKVDELAQANVGLDESNRLKSEFLANVSHELRTPLNSIIGFAELLHDVAVSEAPDTKRVRYLSNIVTSGRSLLEMINELLDMAKIEAGRMEVNIEQTSVSDLIEGLTRLMSPQAETKRIAIQSEIGSRVPMIDTDPGKLQQILYNFMSNALKFTPEGGTVTLRADRITRLNNEQGVRLAVSDTGPGIPDDMQDVIFDKFRQLDASHTREHRGTGLGLAICRELAEMLGASVSFVTDPGRGATFYVDLPLSYRPDEGQPLMASGAG